MNKYSISLAYPPQVESRFKAEMEDHKQKLDREYENLRQRFGRELEKLKVQHAAELDKQVHTTGVFFSFNF